MLKTVEIHPKAKAKRSIIWLHGLGANGHEFEAIVPELGLDESLDIHFVFPHAKIRSVTINGGYQMRAWYDILEININRKIDEKAILESSNEIELLIQKEIDAGVKEENILLAGFSQGGVIALFTALMSKYKLAGLIALSTYLPNKMIHLEKFERLDFPIFIGHGTQDPTVPYHLGEEIVSQLETKLEHIEFHNYPMQHSVCGEEIQDLSRFINRVFQ